MSPRDRLSAVVASLASPAPVSGATPRIIHAPKQPLLDVLCELGESPIYDAVTHTLHFVDIGRNEVHHYDLETKIHTFDVYSDPISCIRLRRNRPGFIAAARHGFAFLPLCSPASSHAAPALVEYLACATNTKATLEQMMNDGEVDPRGKFLAATKVLRGLQVRMEPKEGIMFRVDKGGKVETVIEEIALPNGIGFTEDCKTMYYVDSLLATIWAYDYDVETGTPSNKRLFTNTRGTGSVPDGIALDATDHLWVAKFRGSKVTRYRPDGSIDLEVVFSNAYNITCVEFGGKDLSTLFVTTCYLGESGDGANVEMQAKYDRSGAVFAVELGEYGIEGKAKDGFMNLAKQGFQAYENSQNEGQNNGQQGHNAQGGGQFGVQGSAALNSNDNQGPSQVNFNADEAAAHAAQAGGGGGNSGGMFGQAMQFAQQQASGGNHQLDEQHVTDAHAQAYGSADSSNMSANSMGAAAAMQAFKTMTQGGGAQGGGGGDFKSKMMGQAMAEASKLFDQNGGAGSGNKQDVVNSAGATMMKLMLKSQLSGMMGTGGGAAGGGGFGSMLSMASKFM